MDEKEKFVYRIPLFFPKKLDDIKNKIEAKDIDMYDNYVIIRTDRELSVDELRQVEVIINSAD